MVAVTRVTQKMLTDSSFYSINSNLSKMADITEVMNTGKRINKPSDDATGTTIALRARASIADQTQFQRNIQDGLSWLTTVDSALSTVATQAQRAYSQAVRGANTASQGADAEDAIAKEIDQIKEAMLNISNTTYLGRPVFGGTVQTNSAYQKTTVTNYDGSTHDEYTFVGNQTQVMRRVGPDEIVAVNSPGSDIFGDGSDATYIDPTDPANAGNPDAGKWVAGASGELNIFQKLTNLSVSLRASDNDGIQSGIDDLQGFISNVSTSQADEGARVNRIQAAQSVTSTQLLSMESVRSTAEDADLAEAVIGLNTQQIAYQAALAATARAVQPSLLQFLS